MYKCSLIFLLIQVMSTFSKHVPSTVGIQATFPQCSEPIRSMTTYDNNGRTFWKKKQVQKIEDNGKDIVIKQTK